MAGIFPGISPLFFPKTCLSCNRPLKESTICFRCALPPAPIARDFFGFYEGNLKNLIKEAKYRPSYALMTSLASSFEALFHSHQSVWDIIVPIPPSYETYRKRLFHQTLILAKAAQRALSAPTPISECLGITKPHRQQATLRLRERVDNMKEAFFAGKIAAGKKILLIDDVVTTGATTAAAKFALSSVGADSVDIYSLARSRSYDRFQGRIYNAFGV